MATFASASNQVAALKELYSDDSWVMKDLVYKKNPALALIPKDDSPSGMAGKYFPCPLIYGTPQGRSASFSLAQTNQTAPALGTFFVYRVSNYQVVTITNELLEATKGNAGAFIDEAKLNMDTGFRNHSNDIAHDLFGDGTGLRGNISTITTGVIQLVNAPDVVNFEVGMTLVSYSVTGSVYAQSTGNNLGYVIAVNRSIGTVTVSASVGGAAGTPTNWSAAFPNLGVQGDVFFGTLTTQNQLSKITGLAGWLPTISPSTGESFWGQDRSIDSVRMAGVRFDGSSESIEEALIDASALVAREGGQPDYCFMSFASWAALEKSLGSKVQYVDVKHDEADISFKGITVNAPYGPITVIPDRSCQAQRAYLLQLDTWKLRSLNKVPHILTYGMEGLEGLRVGNADALEIRIGSYANLTCCAPGWNATISLSA